jgi:hydrogenase maturation factor
VSASGAERPAPQAIQPFACDPSTHDPDPERTCITCGDVAVEMLVLTRDDSGLAVCEADGERETVDLTLVEPVGPGDRVLVHAGAALARVGGTEGTA